MEYSKTRFREILEADPCIVSLRQLDRGARDWLLDHYQNFNAACQTMGILARMQTRLEEAIQRAPDAQTRAALWVDLALNAGTLSIYQARQLHPRMHRVIYDTYGSWPKAIEQSGNGAIALRLKANARRGALIKRRLDLRAILEERVAAGIPINLRHDPALNRTYTALIRQGLEGRRAVRAELSRLYTSYGEHVYNPKRLSRGSILRDEGNRLFEALSEIASIWRPTLDPPGSKPCTVVAP